MAKSSRNKIESAGDILGRLKRDTALGKQLKQADLWTMWPEIAGEELAAHALPHRLRQGELRILAESPVWMHKLVYHKRALLRRIARLAPGNEVQDFFVQLADEWPPKFAKGETDDA